jgi:sarcosine oxidase subunit beta
VKVSRRSSEISVPVLHSYRCATALAIGAVRYVSDPNLAVENLRMAAAATGRCEFSFGASVTGLLFSGGEMDGVQLSDGSTIAAPIVVNAAGPHSSAVNAMAFASDGAPPNDMRTTTRPMRQEVAYVNAPRGVDYDKYGPVLTDIDTGIYARPEFGNRILIGGIEPECDPLEYLDHPSEADPSFTSIHTSYLMRLAMRFPELQLPNSTSTQGIVACYDTTPDWTPIYDRSAIPGYYLAIGTR